jgi:oligosaccharide reducing-end xylanase
MMGRRGGRLACAAAMLAGCGGQGLTQVPAQPASAPPPFAVENGYRDKPLGAVRRFPGDGTGAFRTGRSRDLFAEQLGHGPAETRAKIAHAFDRLFHGDGQEERLYFETGADADGPLAYITDWANNDARTEGMSYGMMIAVQLNHKREFDALWNWSNKHMLVTDPANPSVGYFAWSMATDGAPRSTSAAPDGEEYYAMALLFAARRWGNGQGLYDYQAQAERILRGMRHHPLLTGTPPFRVHPGDAPFRWPDQPFPSINNRAAAAEAAKAGKPLTAPFHRTPKPVTVGPMVDEAHAMVRFVPETSLSGTDASYHLPAFYELWARWGPVEDRAFWAEAADVSRDFFPRVADPATALAPDRSHFDGSPFLARDGQPVSFAYDSWRTVSNWSVDQAWWGKDARQMALSDRYQRFLQGQGIDRFPDRYTLNGKPLSTRHSPGMVATAAVGGLAATPGPASRAFLQALWDMPVPSGEQRYYDGLLYLMSLMHCSGTFRIITGPTASPSPPSP